MLVDEATLASPRQAVECLHDCWSTRQPVVVRLAVDPVSFRAPQSITGEPWTHSPHTEPWFDRLHFLVWANNYDARGDTAPVWWWARKASRTLTGSSILHEELSAEPPPQGDIRLVDDSFAWIDGGPRQSWDPASIGAVIHAESVEAGRPRARRDNERIRRGARCRSARRRRTRAWAGAGHRAGRLRQDTRSHRATASPDRRSRLRNIVRSGGRLQQGGRARVDHTHRALHPARAHTQRIGSVGATRTPRPSADSARRTRSSQVRRLVVARSPAPTGQRRSDRAIPRRLGGDPPWPVRSRRRRGIARRRRWPE